MAGGFLRFSGESKARALPTLDDIASLTPDKPAQQVRVAEARPLLATLFVAFDRAIALRCSGGAEGTQSNLEADPTEGAMTRLGMRLIDMKAPGASMPVTGCPVLRCAER
ncbi:CHASE3 domain-containing protein [Xanthobacter autotrophicus]|uniref:CHASE3 domain-containing protein n=1 Tax=Xanthobacter TaxID=279 RepID=UPI0024AAA44A|nr:CHASE3 domain-containing protein [Xanthobacter autotrophicus]MDI4663371.1 CHASE3 domain-containing protein [Xanthobacter autotrophicus]